MQVIKADGLQHHFVRFVGLNPTTCAIKCKKIDGYPEYRYQ